MLAILTALVACNRPSAKVGSGEEWRSWKPEQRQTFVAAYLYGYSLAQHDLCGPTDVEDNLTNRPHTNLDDPNPCRTPRDTYTHIGSQLGPYFDTAAFTAPYVSVIDDFYKHPECRVMPYGELMTHLVDKEYMSGDDMYRLLQSGHAAWGAFSGLKGIEKCYIVPQTHPLN